MGQFSSESALRSLALDAELAGAALGCRYGSSDEYEAALIDERRRAGLYRKRRLEVALLGALASFLLLSMFASF